MPRMKRPVDPVPASTAKEPLTSLMTFSPRELKAGKIFTTSFPELLGEDGSLFLDLEMMDRIEARWRLRSHAFTSAVVGLIGELTNEYVTVENLRDPAFCASLDMDMTPLLVGNLSTLTSEDLLEECWKMVVKMATEFHDQSTTAVLLKRAKRAQKDKGVGSIATILNRYRLIKSESTPYKEAGFLVGIGIVKALDVVRELEKRVVGIVPDSLSKTLRQLEARDVTVLPAEEFDKVYSLWSTALLQRCFESFALPLLETLAGEIPVNGPKLARALLEQIPEPLKVAAMLRYDDDKVTNALKELMEGGVPDCFVEARNELASTRQVPNSRWSAAERAENTAEAGKRFRNLLVRKSTELFEEKFKAIKKREFEEEDQCLYELDSRTILALLSEIETEMAREQSEAGKSLDPATIDWLGILDHHISKETRTNVPKTFSRLVELIADLVMFLNQGSFAFLDADDPALVDAPIIEDLRSRVSDGLKSEIKKLRDSLANDSSAKILDRPTSLSCNHLVFINTTRRCWAEYHARRKLYRRMQPTVLPPATGGTED
jgi:hypothetical protein